MNVQTNMPITRGAAGSNQSTPISNKDILKEMQNGFKGVYERLDAFQEKIDERVTAVENELEIIKIEQDRTRKENDLIVSGIPAIHDENTYDIYLKIASFISFPDTQKMINIFRPTVKRSAEQSNNSIIVLQFSDKFAKASFHACYLACIRTKQLTLSMLEFESNNRIFINESLTSHHQKLLFMARQLVKTGKCVKAFSRHGNVFVVKSRSDSKAVMIRTHIDLEKLK